MARQKGKAGSPARGQGARRVWTAPRRALLVVAVAFAVCADDRQAGRISDSRQMIQTAVALVTTGELGVARGLQISTTARSEGDAAVRYGLGMSLAQVPAALGAPAFDRALGPGASQFLFLLAPLLFGLLAAASAGRVAALLGAGERGQAAAVLLASIGSPLGAYAMTDLSESLQAALLVAGLAFSLQARRVAGRRSAAGWAAAAGAMAGAAVLTKSSLLVVAPWTLLPLLARPARGGAEGTWTRIAAAAAGSVPPLAIFVVADLVRYGGLFRGYAGEGFTYPFLVGAARLLFSVNKGILLFFPALVVAVVEAARRLGPVAGGTGQDEPRAARALETAACLLPLAALFALASPWWAWSGIGGWGPRLLVPGIPPVAALAACAAERWRRPGLGVLLGASIALNALPLLQTGAPISTYFARLGPVTVTEEVASRFPRYDGKAPDGSPQVPGAFIVNEIPLAADHVTCAWFLWVRSASDPRERALRLERTPWASSRPDLVSTCAPFQRSYVSILTPSLGVGFLGRSLFGEPSPVKGKIYALALQNQVLRAQQQRKLERALDLSTRLFALDPRAESAALVAESYRLLGRHETLRAFLDSLRKEMRGKPPVFAVLALAARDVGENEAAAAYLQRAAGLGTPAIRDALSRPPTAWPPDFASFIVDESLTIDAALPDVGANQRRATDSGTPAPSPGR